MADTIGLAQKVREWGRALNDEAVVGLLADLDLVVPDSNSDNSPGEGNTSDVKLRNSRTVIETETGDVFTTVVTYTLPLEGGDLAEFTEQGTSEHIIEPKGEGYPLRFFWPKVDAEVRFMHVLWKPGPGVARNIGWFSHAMANWPAAVADALGTVTSP